MGPTIHVILGHMRLTSLDAAAAAAKAIVAWPEGNDCRLPEVNPPANLKSCGLVSAETKGRERPTSDLITSEIVRPTMAPSVVCHPRSFIFSLWLMRPMRYTAGAATNTPGSAR